MFFQETYERRLAEELGCEDRLFFTVDPLCRLLCWFADFRGRTKIIFSRCTIGFDSAPSPGLLSVLLATGQATSKEGRHQGLTQHGRKFENRSRFKRQKSTLRERTAGCRGIYDIFGVGDASRFRFRALFRRFSPTNHYISDPGKAVQR